MDRSAFFDGVRAAPFGGTLTKTQVSGMETLLDMAPPLLPLDHLAYCLATTFHETGLIRDNRLVRTMEPVEEYGRGKGRPYGPTGFWGRGYVQLTWETNYAKATRRLRELGYLTGREDLVAAPALAMDPQIAARILFVGMTEGWFTGKKLSDYFRPGLSAPINARRIVNGTDKAALISTYHAQFRAALVAAGYAPGSVTRPPVAAPVTVSPVPPVPPSPAAPDRGFWSVILDRLRAAYPPKG